MNRLHDQGYSTDPRGKAKSVVFTEQGLAVARRTRAGPVFGDDLILRWYGEAKHTLKHTFPG